MSFLYKNLIISLTKLFFIDAFYYFYFDALSVFFVFRSKEVQEVLRDDFDESGIVGKISSCGVKISMANRYVSIDISDCLHDMTIREYLREYKQIDGQINSIPKDFSTTSESTKKKKLKDNCPEESGAGFI